jgi:hypothetical protein
LKRKKNKKYTSERDLKIEIKGEDEALIKNNFKY